jgi:hypothetical protein
LTFDRNIFTFKKQSIDLTNKFMRNYSFVTLAGLLPVASLAFTSTPKYQTRKSALYETVTEEETSEDLFPSDPAKTTPEFLAGLWNLIAKGNTMVRGVSIYYTQCAYYTLYIIVYGY